MKKNKEKLEMKNSFLNKINKKINKLFETFLEINFVKKNYNIIQKILIIIWFIFVIKLFLFWVRISSWWGGFINFSILPTFHYSWTNAWTISVILFVLFLYLLFKIKLQKSKTKKLKIAFLIFILWIFSNQIFLLVSPDFKFYLTPVTKQYKIKDWTKVNDIDEYLRLVNKYCKEGNFYFKMNSRYLMCAYNNKLESDFNSVDEYIKVLESAKKNNFRLLYTVTIKWLLNSDFLEETIKKYNDDTFYAYLIDYKWSTIEFLNLIDNNINNIYINSLIWKIKEYLIFFNENEENMDYYENRDFWKTLEDFTIIELKKIKTVNQNLLY